MVGGLLRPAARPGTAEPPTPARSPPKHRPGRPGRHHLSAAPAAPATATQAAAKPTEAPAAAARPTEAAKPAAAAGADKAASRRRHRRWLSLDPHWQNALARQQRTQNIYSYLVEADKDLASART